MAGEVKLTDLTCPFCKEDGFDDIGLKNHFLRWCDAFKKVPTIAEEVVGRESNNLRCG